LANIEIYPLLISIKVPSQRIDFAWASQRKAARASREMVLLITPDCHSARIHFLV
jgi:hypothetical protein